jgi:hypothetical protein
MVVLAELGWTDCDPLLATGPDQSLSVGFAEAMHELTFLLVQVSITAWPNVTALGDAEIETTGTSLPPPHPVARQSAPTRKINIDLFITISALSCAQAAWATFRQNDEIGRRPHRLLLVKPFIRVGKPLYCPR